METRYDQLNMYDIFSITDDGVRGNILYMKLGVGNELGCMDISTGNFIIPSIQWDTVVYPKYTSSRMLLRFCNIAVMRGYMTDVERFDLLHKRYGDDVYKVFD